MARASEHLSDLVAKRIPDAAARALTRTAFDARDAVREGLPERFNLRRPWVSRGVGVTPAKPRTLRAEVWSRDRFMALQEAGGTKTGKLAIPTSPMAKVAQTRVIPKSQWPGPMLAKKGVFYRAGSVFERRGQRRILAWYLLRRQQKVEPRLGMADTVRNRCQLSGALAVECQTVVDLHARQRRDEDLFRWGRLDACHHAGLTLDEIGDRAGVEQVPHASGSSTGGSSGLRLAANGGTSAIPLKLATASGHCG